MCLLCTYTTRMVSGWPMLRGQPAIVDGASVREPARFAPLRKGAPADFNCGGQRLPSLQSWRSIKKTGIMSSDRIS